MLDHTFCRSDFLKNSSRGSFEVQLPNGAESWQKKLSKVILLTDLSIHRTNNWQRHLSDTRVSMFRSECIERIH